MKPALDDIFLPCGWAATAFREDRIEFTRGADRITLVAKPTDESPEMPELCGNQLWRLTCEQRAGEARSDIHLGCVSTTDTAVETLLTYMRRINEVAGPDDDTSLKRLRELFHTVPAGGDHDEWGRTTADRLDVQPLP